MYLYDEIDQRLVDERVAQFRDQTRRYPRRQALGGRLPPAAAAERPLHPALCADAARGDPLRPAVLARSCASSRTSRASTTAATATSPRARTCSSTGRSWRRCPTILAELATVQMHAIQTSGNCVRNITTDHFAGVARDEIVDSFVWCELIRASGRRSIPSSPTCRASSRSRSTAPRPTAPRPSCTTSACTRCATPTGEVGFRVIVGGGLGRTPIDRPRDPRVPAVAAPAHLPRGDPARLQPPRPARQQSTRRASRSWCKERGAEAFRDEVEAEWAHLQGRPVDADRGGGAPHREPLHAAGVREAGRTRTASLAAQLDARPALRRLARSATCTRTSSPATPR